LREKETPFVLFFLCHCILPANKNKCDPEMIATCTLEESALRERQGACLGQVALYANREEDAKRGKNQEGWLLLTLTPKNGSP
jgi:hypothetical protein